MMKTNFFLKRTRQALLLLTLLVGAGVNAQSFLVTFPNHDVVPVQNARNLTVINETTLVEVHLAVSSVLKTDLNISIQLPIGIEYLIGLVTKNTASTSTALTIGDNGGGANAPNTKTMFNLNTAKL